MIGSRSDKLGIAHSTIVVILQEHIGPAVSHHVDVAQIYHIVLISIDVIAVVVEVVERCVEIGAELNAQDSRDDGCRSIEAVASGNDGTVVPHYGWTPCAIGWSDGSAPAPTIVAVIVIPAIVWTTWSDAAMPAIAVVVGSWATVVDATMVWAATRTVVASATAGIIAMSSARAVIARAIVAAAMSTAGTVIAGAIVAAAIVSAAVSTAWTVLAWAIVATAVVAAMSTAVIAVAGVYIAAISIISAGIRIVSSRVIYSGTVVAARTVIASIAVVASGTVVATIAGSHGNAIGSFAILVARLIGWAVVVIAVVLGAARSGVRALILVTFVVVAIVASATVITVTMVSTTAWTFVSTRGRDI